jgi:hypothetical protein
LATTPASAVSPAATIANFGKDRATVPSWPSWASVLMIQCCTVKVKTAAAALQ